MINSLNNELSLCGGISSSGLDSFFSVKKFLKQSNILFSFLLGVFVFLSFDSSTEAICTNLELLEENAMVRLLPSEAVRERRENLKTFVCDL